MVIYGHHWPSNKKSPGGKNHWLVSSVSWNVCGFYQQNKITNKDTVGCQLRLVGFLGSRGSVMVSWVHYCLSRSTQKTQFEFFRHGSVMRCNLIHILSTQKKTDFGLRKSISRSPKPPFFTPQNPSPDFRFSVESPVACCSFSPISLESPRSVCTISCSTSTCRLETKWRALKEPRRRA